MCYNAATSITTFIVGTVVAVSVGAMALVQKKYELAALCFGWIWVLGMQLWEYFIWRYPKNLVYVKWAYIFNITQPIVLALLFLSFFSQPLSNRLVVFFLLLFYILYLFQERYESKELKRDPNIQYSWWNNYGGYVYMLFLVSLFLLLIRPFYWSMATIIYILILFILSWFFYKRAVASLWCFFAVTVPLVSFLVSFYCYR